MWFNRYISLNFKVHFSSEHWVASWIFSNNESNFTQLFSSTVQTFEWWMSAALSVFKLTVQNVHQLQQHTIEVSFEMTGLPYQWTPVANHSISITRQSSARQCWSVLPCISDSDPASRGLRPTHNNPMEWDLANSLAIRFSPLLCQHRRLITCSLWKMHI